MVHFIIMAACTGEGCCPGHFTKSVSHAVEAFFKQQVVWKLFRGIEEGALPRMHTGAIRGNTRESPRYLRKWCRTWFNIDLG